MDKIDQNNLKNREFGSAADAREGPGDLRSEKQVSASEPARRDPSKFSSDSGAERATIAGRQGVSEHGNFEENPTQPKTDSSDNFGLDWLKPGLKFQCTGCGQCCTGPSGFVYLTDSDLTRFAEHLQMSKEQFLLNYTRRIDGMLALLDRPGSSDCIFLKENRCSVYEGRPTQCRTFPWWLHNLRTPDDWNRAAQSCEGINHPDAPLISSEEIEEQLNAHMDNLWHIVSTKN